MRKLVALLSLAVAAVGLAASPASAGGAFIRIDDKIPLAQGGASVTGTIRCASGELFRSIHVTLGQDGTVAEGDGGVQCDGSKQHFDVYVSGSFHPGDAKAAATSQPNDGYQTTSGPVLRDHRSVVIQAPLQ